MSKFAVVQGIHQGWLQDKEVCQRVDEGGRLIKATSGTFVHANEAHCLENSWFLQCYMERQFHECSLDLPDLESLKAEFKALFLARAAAKRAGKQPKAVQQATLDLIETSAHLDSKSFKRLLSYMRWRFLKTHLAGIESIQDPLHEYERCMLAILSSAMSGCPTAAPAKDDSFRTLLQVWGKPESCLQAAVHL